MMKSIGRSGVAVLAGLALATSPALSGSRLPKYVNVTRDVALKAMETSRAARPGTGARTALTLAQCRQLALERNLSLEQVDLDVSAKGALANSYEVQMFPRLNGSAELSHRNKFYFSFSDVLGRDSSGPGSGGTGVDQFARARDLGTWRPQLETRWSPTDALLAYYLKENTKNEQLKDKLMRIRVAQKLLGVVDAGFYRLLELNQVLPKARELLKLRQDLVAQSDALFRESLTLVEDLHRVNQKLTQAQGLVAGLENEAQLQREYLGSAMRVSPETLGDEGFALAGKLEQPHVPEDMRALERQAIEKRPEAYQAGLDHLSAVNDVRRTQVKDWPKITAFGRYTKDIDRHLLFNDWTESGGYVYFDVIDWLANAQERRAARVKRARTKSEIETVALGIATQVREAALRYQASVVEEQTSARLLASAKHLLDIVRGRRELGGQTTLSVLEAEGDVLLEEIAHGRAVGEANARRAELEAAIGSNYDEPLPER